MTNQTQISDEVKSETGLGYAIQQRRKHEGISQKQLGILLGCSGAYINQIERGKRTPSINTLGKISLYFGLEPHELMLAGAEATKKLKIARWLNQIAMNKDTESLKELIALAEKLEGNETSDKAD